MKNKKLLAIVVSVSILTSLGSQERVLPPERINVQKQLELGLKNKKFKRK